MDLQDEYLDFILRDHFDPTTQGSMDFMEHIVNVVLGPEATVDKTLFIDQIFNNAHMNLLSTPPSLYGMNQQLGQCFSLR